ncbi:MAG: MBL fold metallo-hydrolase [Desulfobacterales bacterium]|jgi:L-ascorbate metabolism protein UlaG (beta-lactamase superfamily)
MTRRRFIQQLMRGITSASLFGISGACVSGTPTKSDASNGQLPYRPLNGKSMRDLAKRKLHHGQGEFLNPFSDIPRGGLGRVIQWKWFSRNTFKKDYRNDVITPVILDRPQFEAPGKLAITFIKHAGILIRDDDDYLLVDPVFKGLFWFIEDFSPLTFDAGALPQPKHILITHGHYDHLDVASLGTWGKDTHIVCPPGYDDLFNDLGMSHRQPLDWFESLDEGDRQITFLPCNHWTMRNPLIGPNTALWGSYLIETKSGATIYLSGDTGYFDGFEQIGAEFDIDLAIFNLGAYEPRWFMAPSHMNPEETIQAFRELRARHLAIVHWGSFRLGDEPVHLPPLDMRKALRSEQLENRYLELKHGQTLTYA